MSAFKKTKNQILAISEYSLPGKLTFDQYRDSNYSANEIFIRSTIGFDLLSVESVRRIWT